MQITMPQDSRCYVEISRSRIAANYRAVRDAVRPGAQVMGVVKANAYGQGAAEVARVLCARGHRMASGQFGGRGRSSARRGRGLPHPRDGGNHALGV